MLINWADAIKRLTDVKNRVVKEADGLNVPEIDKHFRFKSSNFNIILGHSNVGKTTVAFYLMLLYSIKHNKRWLIYSAENECHTLIRKLLEFYEKKVIYNVTEVGYKNTLSFLEKHFKFISNEKLYSYKDLIELGTSLKKSWDYHGFFIDPYNSLKKDSELLKGLGGHEYDYAACSEFRVFCRKNNVSIWLTTHANTEAARKKHTVNEKYAGYSMPPSGSDVEGGSKFVNKADDFLIFHRYKNHSQDWNITYINVEKIKEIETGGLPTSKDNPIELWLTNDNTVFNINGQDVLQIVKTPTKQPF